MNFIGIEPIDILAHIRFIWETEMANLLCISEVCDAPIYGSVAGEEPPPPPKAKMDYYFQLNTKHGISLRRAQYLFNNEWSAGAVINYVGSQNYDADPTITNSFSQA